MGRPALTLDETRYGRWTVLGDGPRKGPHYAVICRCDCGTVRNVMAAALRKGNSLSCGCIGREILGNNARRHGVHKHHLYSTWRAMRERCRSPKHVAYHRYGGRGISVCERWNDFAAFLDDMLPSWREGLTLDRINTDGDYAPENCRWATPQEQSRNTASNHYITLCGETMLRCEWPARLGITQGAFDARMSKGWSEERIISTPLRPY